MDRSVALRIIFELNKVRDTLANIEYVAREIDDREEFAFFMKEVFQLISELESGPLTMVCKKWPDLAPYYLRMGIKKGDV